MRKVVVRAEVVRELLLRRNLSQNGLAQKVGLSQGYLSQLLRRERTPGPRTRERLMDALRVQDFDALFELEEAA